LAPLAEGMTVMVRERIFSPGPQLVLQGNQSDQSEILQSR